VVIAVMSGFDRFLEDKMIGTNAHLFLILQHPKTAVCLDRKIKDPAAYLEGAPFVAASIF